MGTASCFIVLAYLCFTMLLPISDSVAISTASLAVLPEVTDLDNAYLWNNVLRHMEVWMLQAWQL